MGAIAMFLEQDLSHQKFEKIDFSGQDLSKRKVTGSVFRQCNFDDADLSDGDWEQCDFVGSSFRGTNCHYTSFKNSKLGSTVFEPRDAFGMTLTLHCKTFENIQISQQWFFSYLMFACLMRPAAGPVKEPLVDKLIATIGAERYVRLKMLFERCNV